MKDHARRQAPKAYRHGGHNGSSNSLKKQLLLHKKRPPALITDSTRLFPDGLSSSSIHELPVDVLRHSTTILFRTPPDSPTDYSSSADADTPTDYEGQDPFVWRGGQESVEERGGGAGVVGEAYAGFDSEICACFDHIVS